MTMTDDRKPGPPPAGANESPGLEPFFEAALQTGGAATDAPPGEDLMARVLADAAAHCPAAPAALPRRIRRPRLDLLALMGGWKGVAGFSAGLSAAAVTGLWIGVSPPSPVADTAAGLFGTGTAYVIDLDPSAAYLGGEGAL